MKRSRHHVNEFVVIMLPDLFEFSAPSIGIQMQHDLQKQEMTRGSFSVTRGPFPSEESEEGEKKAHIEPHRAYAQLAVRLVEILFDFRLFHERSHLAQVGPFAHPIEDTGQHTI